MKNIDAKIIHRFLKLAIKSLKGDWVLVGGSVLPALGIDHRTTLDIDIVSLGKTTNDDMDNLMQIAEKLGLGIEAINQGAGYFVRKEKISTNELELLYEGDKCRIFIPNLDTYIKLKISRLSESDMQDCLALIKQKKDKNARSQAKKRILTALKKEGAKEKVARLNEILKAF